MVFSNVNRVVLADRAFEPLWSKADELGAVIYIHPTDPAGVESMLEFWLMPLGFSSIRYSPTRASCSVAWSSGTREFVGYSRTWAGRFRISPSPWIEAGGHLRLPNPHRCPTK